MKVLQQLSDWLSAEGPESPTITDENSSHLLASLLTMAWFVEARDPYTGGHLWRVSRYARLLADHAGFTSAEAARISLGGFLHDLGKVGIPDAILRKPDRLTDAEYAVIKTHPEIGLRMLSGHPLAQLVSDAVLLHHERPDGQGYPHGMIGKAIPAMARIVGICDAFDAMTSHRPYRSGMPLSKALTLLHENRATQFDAQLTAHFIELGETGSLEHVMGHSDEGIPLQSCPMCGPTLVLKAGHKEGDHIYCRNCGGEFALTAKNKALQAQPTGAQGEAVDLVPDADPKLIERTVREAVAALPIADLLKAAAIPRLNEN